jgi:hypothetical protein
MQVDFLTEPQQNRLRRHGPSHRLGSCQRLQMPHAKERFRHRQRTRKCRRMPLVHFKEVTKPL